MIRNRLKKLVLDELSLVPDGMNQYADVVLTKEAPDAETAMILGLIDPQPVAKDWATWRAEHPYEPHPRAHHVTDASASATAASRNANQSGGLISGYRASLHRTAALKHLEAVRLMDHYPNAVPKQSALRMTHLKLANSHDRQGEFWHREKLAGR